MPPDGQAELAHPEAADWMLGNLKAAEAARFQQHLASCPHCQAAITELGPVAQIAQGLPPAAQPPPGLEDRTITAVLATATRDRAATQPHQSPAAPPKPADASPSAQVPGIPAAAPGDGVGERPGGGPAKVTRMPVWRRHQGRLAAVVAAAAAVLTGAIAIPLSLLGSGATTVVIPLSATATTTAKVNGFTVSGLGAPMGQATARQDASGSWNITLTVHHLKSFGDVKWYECWYIGSKSGQRQVASAGTFQVHDSGSWTFTMTSAVDPTMFKTMVITIQSPSQEGFKKSNAILSGHTL